ncbi:MAG: DUF423 domain-containing protein [Melioribacteraceae bacterium]|nr:DUF423 domain-containing protein [Melioribacteraceae bacterium]
MNQRIQITIAAIMGFLGVALGAFGAHGLSDTLSENMLETYKTGVLYHLIHSAVLIAIAFSSYKLIKSFAFISAGIILFSFSLYAYSITEITFLAMITPVGGVSFLIGWIMIVFESRR